MATGGGRRKKCVWMQVWDLLQHAKLSRQYYYENIHLVDYDSNIYVISITVNSLTWQHPHNETISTRRLLYSLRSGINIGAIRFFFFFSHANTINYSASVSHKQTVKEVKAYRSGLLDDGLLNENLRWHYSCQLYVYWLFSKGSSFL